MQAFFSEKEKISSFPAVRAEIVENNRKIGYNTTISTLCIILCIIPVSYTHLDVYKRQVMDASMASLLFCNKFAPLIQYFGVNGTKMHSWAGAVEPVYTVSYTHLDVYKRQV